MWHREEDDFDYFGYMYGNKTSVSKSNIIYGPVDGGWFDPVRPE